MTPPPPPPPSAAHGDDTPEPAPADRSEAGGQPRALPELQPGPDAPDAIRRGAEHFNAGRFFDAHEAWEDHWHSVPPGPTRDAVQALIQVAVALEHHQRGNATGARRTLRRAAARLLGAGSAAADLHGIDVARWLRLADGAITSAPAHP